MRCSGYVFRYKVVSVLLFLIFLCCTPGLSLAIGILQGTVTDAASGNHIAGASINSDTGFSASANASGDYFLVLPVGVPHVVTISSPDYVSQSREMVLTDAPSTFNAALEVKILVQGVYPTLGEVGKPLPITVTGYGFKENSRVSMNLDSKNRMKLLGSVSLSDYPADVAVDGTLAYAVTANSDTDQMSTFEVIDVSDPTSPLLIGSFSVISANFSNVVVDGTRARAYVADTVNGLQIIDISNPSVPAILYTVAATGGAFDVDLLGTFALVATYTGGLKIVDVSNDSPASYYTSVPVVCRDVTAAGTMAYVSDLSSGVVTVIDLSNPLIPAVRGAVNTPGTPQDLAAVGQYVFVADNYVGLQVVDVSDPDAPVIIGSADTPDYAVGVAVDGSMAYVADSNSGLVMVDVTDPVKPIIVGTVATPRKPEMSVNSAALSVAVVGSLALVADRYTGLHAIDVTAPAPLNLIGAIDIDGGASNVRIVGSRAYLTVKRLDDAGLFVIGGALRAYDVSNPSSPLLVDSVDFSIVATDMVIVNNKAFVVGNISGQPSQLLLIDVNENNPETYLNITGILTFSVGVEIEAVDVDGNNNKAYVASKSDGVFVVELNLGPTYLTVVASYNTPDGYLPYTSTSIFVDNGVVYWTRYLFQLMSIVSSHLVLVDVGDPYNPSLLGMESTLDLAWDVFVQGTTAFVADGGNLKVVDVSNTASPITIGTWTSPGSGVKSIIRTADSKVFLADAYNGLLMIDVTDPAAPVLIGSVDSRGYPERGVIAGEMAYIVEKDFGLTILPVPVELSTVSYDGVNMISTTLGSPLVAGNYSIRVFNGSNSDQLIGGVSFTDKLDLLTSKAIIVAGGGNYAGNLIWEETKAYANYAYDNLIYQGYKHEDITYLTDLPNALARYGTQASGANLLPATKTNLQNAILSWAVTDPDASDLLIFMEDHGDSEEFLLRGGAVPENVTADELDAWLDTMQGQLKGKVILLYDACRSGSFISRMIPPPGKTRLTLTSSASGQTAYFLSTSHSFSSHFWSTFTGKSGDKARMTDAFVRGADTMSMYQTAQLDVNGNGVPNEAEDYTGLEGHEGTIYALRRQFSDNDRSKPVVGVVAADNLLSGTTTATLMAKSVYDIDGDAIVRVWAEVVAPDFNLDTSASTVTSAQVPAITLLDPELDGEYLATKSNYFTTRGTYIITYYAEDASGIYSLPVTSLVQQPAGNQVLVPDQYENDDTYQNAQVMVLNSPTPQSHSFHVAGDMDWVMFYGVKDQVYTIKAADPTIISDPVVALFRSTDVINPVKISNISGSGQEEAIVGWICPEEGLYYVRLSNNSGHFGANVRYKLNIFNPIALSLPGYITGRITSGGTGVAGAVVRVGGGTAITLADGSYILYLMPGGYTASVSCGGYQGSSFSVTVGSGQHVSLPPVDVNSIPRIINVPALTVEANEEYIYTPVVVDVDGDSYTFSITGKPVWATFSTDTGRLQGRPGAANEGTHGPVTISATDTAGASGSVVFYVQVLRGGGASLPSIYLLLSRP